MFTTLDHTRNVDFLTIGASPVSLALWALIRENELGSLKFQCPLATLWDVCAKCKIDLDCEVVCIIEHINQFYSSCSIYN